MANRKAPLTPLQAARRSKFRDQETPAGLLGVSQQTLSKYETYTLIPSDEVKARIAQLFGSSVSKLWPRKRAAAKAA